MTDKPMMDINSVAEHLAVTQRFVRRLVSERRIPYYKVGHFIRFDQDDVENWLRDQRRDSGQPSSSGHKPEARTPVQWAD